MAFFAATLICGLVSCVEPSDELRPPRPELTVTQAGTWCRLIRFTITSDTTVTPDYPDNTCAGSTQGLLARKLVGQPMLWSAANGRTLTVPIRMENRTSFSIVLPFRIELPAGAANVKVIIPANYSNSTIVPLHADSTRGNGTKVWLVGGTGLLAPGDTSVVRNLTFQVDTPVVKAELWFVLKGDEEVFPGTAPDSFPAYFSHDSTFAGLGVARSALIVIFDDGATTAAKKAAVDSVAGSVVGGIAASSGEGRYLISIPSATTRALLDSATAILYRQPGVARIEKVLEPVGPAVRQPLDGTGFSGDDWSITPDSSAGLNHYFEEIGLPLAWGCETGSASVEVGVVDDYFRKNNYGANLPDAVVNPITPFAINASAKHGMLVSSIIGSAADDGVGMSGVAWRTTLKPYQVRGLSGNYVLNAIEDAIKAGVDVINISMGRAYNGAPGAPAVNDTLTALVNDWRHALDSTVKAASANSGNPIPVIVVAAGNDRREAKYAGIPLLADVFPEAIVAGGSMPRSGSQRDRWGGSNVTAARDSGSNWGPLVTVYAGAYQVPVYDSLVPKWDSVTGTSFAAPQVAGIAALLKSFNPALTSSQIVSLIKAGADSGNRVVQNTGGLKLANAYESLRLASRQSASAPVCGIRVQASPTGWVILGRSTPDSVPRSGTEVYGTVSVAQGGRKIAVTSLFGAGAIPSLVDVFTFSGGSWSRTTTSGSEDYFSIQFLERDTAYLRADYSQSTKEKLYVTLKSNTAGRSVTEVEATGGALGSINGEWDYAMPTVSPTGDWILYHWEGIDGCNSGYWYDANAYQSRTGVTQIAFSTHGCHSPAANHQHAFPAFRSDGRAFMLAVQNNAYNGMDIFRWFGVTPTSLGTAASTIGVSGWYVHAAASWPGDASLMILHERGAVGCRAARRNSSTGVLVDTLPSAICEWSISSGPNLVAARQSGMGPQPTEPAHERRRREHLEFHERKRAKARDVARN